MPDRSQTDLLERRRRVLPESYRTFYDAPLDIESAAGVWITADGGRRYLDAYNNVPVIGHSNPLVREAVAAELARSNAHTRYLDARVVEYAEGLLAHFAAPLDRVVFTCSGSEANDLALQVARSGTGRHGVIVTANAYHGTTASIAEISPSLRPDPPAFVERVALPTGPDNRAAQFALEVERAVAALADRGHAPAAFIVDTALTSDGILGSTDWLARGAAVARAHDALIIADEVQAGFCRLGRWWGYELHRLEPDLVTLGKPMGNGLPIGGLVGRRDLLDEFGRTQRYFNTFAGTPATIAAANVVLHELERQDAAARVERLGERFRSALRDRLAPMVEPDRVSGAGLMTGIDLAASAPDGTAFTARTVNLLRERGVLLSSTGADASTLKIRPPLVIGEDELDLLVTTIADALRAALAERGES